MNLTPTLPKPDLNEAFLEMTSKKFSDSYKWLNEQYDNKCKRLAEYAALLKHSEKYVMHETAFLMAFYQHLKQIKKHSQYIDVIMKTNNDLSAQIRIMEKIFILYGISFLEVQKYMINEPLLDQDIKNFKKKNMILTPIALKNHLKQNIG